MNLYFELLQKPVFTIEYVNQFYDNLDSARSAVKRLMKQGLVSKIRNNMYTCISGETGAPVANRFQIACAITPSAYLSHHTAVEYYGWADQVYYDVYVSSDTKFNEFEFNGYHYKYVPANDCQDGIICVEFSGGVRVTDKERTLLDSVKDMDKISGLEEVVAVVEVSPKLNEKRLLTYLKEYHNQFLYQKTGYLLEQFRENKELSDEFFEECLEQTGKSKRYLSRDINEGSYDAKWKMVVPTQGLFLKNGEYEID